MITLSAMQIDTLTEVINLGMGTAAASLSEMVNEEITLSVPTLSFLSKSDASASIDQKTHKKMTGISQKFDGHISGDALLLFPENNSLELVRLLLKETVSLELLSEMEQEAMSEIGNIILNAGLSSIANFMNTDINSGLPLYLSGSSLEIMNNASSSTSEDGIVLFVKVEFGIASYEIAGNVIYMMNIDSILEITNSIDNYLSGIKQVHG